MMNKQYEFNVLGQKIVTKNAEEAAIAEKAGDLVSRKLSDIQSTHPKLSQQQIAVLALMEIAGDLIKERKVIDDYRRDLDRKCTSLLTELDGLKKRASH